VFVFLRRRELPGLVRVGAILGFAASVALCFGRNTHGPSLLIGMLLASLIKKPKFVRDIVRVQGNAAKRETTSPLFLML
jgi:hypothetical protein